MSDRDPATAGLEAALREAYQAEDRADYEKAMQALTRAIELAGSMAPPDKILDLRSRIAWYAAQAGRFDDAVRMYRDVLSQRERNSEPPIRTSREHSCRLPAQRRTGGRSRTRRCCI